MAESPPADDPPTHDPLARDPLTRDPLTRDSAGSRAAAHLRAVADRLVAATPDDPLLDELARDLAQLRSRADQLAPEPTRVWSQSSAFAGTMNVTAPPMIVERAADEHGDLLRAHVQLGVRHQGPTDAVHGGIVAGMLDELLGAAVSQLSRHRSVVTGKLDLRYRRLTPLGSPLVLEARVTGEGSRAVHAAATCMHDGLVTVEATALFVRVPSRS